MQHRSALPLNRRAVCAFAALLAFSPLAPAKDAPEPVALDANFKPAEQAAGLVDVRDTSALKGVKRVAVPQFTVEFVTADNVSAETSSFGMAGRSKATAYYKLVGVVEADFQALAEGFHAAFLQQLQTSGLQVVSPAELAAAPAYRKLLEGATPLPVRGDAAITVAPAGMAMYGMNRAQTGMAKPGLFGAISSFGNVASAIASVGGSTELQKELGDATLLELTLRVHFVQLSSNTKGFWGKMNTTAQASGKAAVSVQSATLSVMTGPTVSTATLKQPLVLDPAAFSEVRVQAKSAGDVAGAVAVGLLRLAIGSKDSQSSEAFEAVADNGRYREVVAAGLASVGELFSARVKAER